MCHAVRAPGSNVTLAPAARAGAFTWNKGSMRTLPVNHSAGPLLDGCEPTFLISIFEFRSNSSTLEAPVWMPEICLIPNPRRGAGEFQDRAMGRAWANSQIPALVVGAHPAA